MDGNSKLSFEWKIKEFTSLTTQSGECLESPPFHFYCATWCLIIYPNGCNTKFSNYISVFLKKLSCQVSHCTVFFTISIKRTDRTDYIYFRDKRLDCETHVSWGWKKFSERSELLKEIHEIAPDGVLTISCTFMWTLPRQFYGESQWSPLNPEGKKQYDRVFLLHLQISPLSLCKPKNLPNLNVIKDQAHIQTLPEVCPAAPVTVSELSKNKVRRILNKLTLQNFQTCVDQVKYLDISTQKELIIVVDVMLKIAVQKKLRLYAAMCKELALIKVPLEAQPKMFVSFKDLLWTACQKELEVTSCEFKREERIKAIEDEDIEKREKLKLELEDEEKKMKYRQLGIIWFIGELFQLDMVDDSTMHDCIKKLITQYDEESIECLCELLKTIIKKIEEKPNKQREAYNTVDQHLIQIHVIVDRYPASSAVRLMLQDVMNFRMNNWVTKDDDNNSKTTYSVQTEAKHESAEQHQGHQNMPYPKRMRDEREQDKGHWSPLNPEGKKQYDRNFLLQLQTCPLSLCKPRNLPKLNVIKDKAHIHKLPEVYTAAPMTILIKVPLAAQPGKFVSFKDLLLTACKKQLEVESCEFTSEERIKAIKDEDTEMGEKLKLELEDEVKKMKYRQLGIIWFIGELFQLGMVDDSTVHDCIKMLITQGDEESIECLCELLKTIGKQLDETANKQMEAYNSVDQYLNQMHVIVGRYPASSAVRLMLQDLMNIKMNNWVIKEDENNPETSD